MNGNQKERGINKELLLCIVKMGLQYIKEHIKSNILSKSPPYSKPFTFNERLELSVLHCSSLKIDLQGHEEYKEEFVIFVQASDGVYENFICQVLNNICNSLLR